MQPPVLLPHNGSVAARHFVEAHRKLHHTAITGGEDVEHLLQFDAVKHLLACLASLPPFLLVHENLPSAPLASCQLQELT